MNEVVYTLFLSFWKLRIYYKKNSINEWSKAKGKLEDSY